MISVAQKKYSYKNPQIRGETATKIRKNSYKNPQIGSRKARFWLRNAKNC
jgi:hypothetical protein